MSPTDEKQILQELRNDLGVEINAFIVKGIKFPVALRRGTIDEWIFNNIFNHKEYEMPLVDFQPRFIIDCGANIGCSAVYFANEYPAAKIIAVEPEDTNFRMLTYNAHFYDNIDCRHAAIWNKATHIKVVPNNNTTDCMTVETMANDPQAIESTTILKLLNEPARTRLICSRSISKALRRKCLKPPTFMIGCRRRRSLRSSCTIGSSAAVLRRCLERLRDTIFILRSTVRI